jgi:uncharacterized delta-60 repeat protein
MWLTSRKARHEKTSHRRRAHFRPCLEALEDRCCPSGGQLNTSFGNAGIASVPTAAAVAAQSNGDIVSVGTTGTTDQEQITVSRLTPTGALDPTFGSGGVVNLTVPGKSAGAFGDTVLIQPDGKILVGGFAVVSKFNPSDEEFVVARVNANGTLDKSFGHGGMFVWNATAYRDDVRGLALLPNGDILATGNTNGAYIGSQGDAYGLFRLTPGGALDKTFGQSGLAVAAFNGPDSPAGSIVLDPNGDILLCGHDGGNEADLVAFTSQGAPDMSFGGTGYLRYAPPAGYTGYNFASMDLQGNELVMAGSLFFVGTDGNTYPQGVVSRYSLAGALDTSFGTNGFFIPNYFSSSFGPMILEADGSIVVAGPEPNPSQVNGGIVGHILANGQADTTFGTDGTGFVSYPSLPGSCLALTGNYIVVCGGPTGNGQVAELTAS